MTAPTLHYIYDALCGWCYAAAPLVEAARRNGFEVILHGGALWDAPTSLAADKRFYIEKNDRRIAELAGVPFGPAYLDGLLQDPRTVLWSQPTVAAILAAGALGAGSDKTMLRAIQDAHYVDGRTVVDPAVLEALAVEIGLSLEGFRQAVQNSAVTEHISATRLWMQTLGLMGYPGFVIRRGDQVRRLPHEAFYGRPEAFVRAIADRTDPGGLR